MQFKIVPDKEEHYELSKFHNHPAWKPTCRLSAPDKSMLMSAPIKTILEKCSKNKYPLRQSNLDFALGQIGEQPSNPVKPDPMTWPELMVDILHEIQDNHLKNLEYYYMYCGDDFILVSCKSKSQAKKLQKFQLFKNDASIKVDRKEYNVVIVEMSK